MTYKEKKLKELEESKNKFEVYSDLGMGINYEKLKDFLSSTIDEILGCLPDRGNAPYDFNSFSFPKEKDFVDGHNKCREDFLQNLEGKAGEL